MRTVTFKSVFESVVHLVGLDPDTAAFSATQKARYVDHMNRRLGQAWEFDYWPELTTIEERTAVDLLIAYEQAGETKLGTVRNVYESDPAEGSSVGVVKFWLSAAGIQLDTTAPEDAFVEFRLRPPEFTLVEWDGAVTYAADDVRYVAATGHCYTSLQAANLNQDPTTETAWWEQIEFPWIAREFVRMAAGADELRHKNNFELADAREADAWVELNRRHGVEFQQQKQTHTARVVTY